MKKIIEFGINEEVKFSKDNLPMLIHGIEHSGASLLSITISAILHKAGVKLLIFTAYPMAKEEFLKQLENEASGVFYIENESNITEAVKYKTIIVQSGNQDLFVESIKKLGDISERAVFVKNIETIDNPELIKILPKDLLIISGDAQASKFYDEIKNFLYKTKILFSPLENEEKDFPELQKYQAFLTSSQIRKIILLS